jgi:dTDP-4-dehydrorhamnose 3,5-epimerase-like enzyme
MSEKMDYQYVVDDLWRPETALYSVNPMDPELAIDWGKCVPVDKITRSERDTKSPTFAEFTKLMKENGQQKIIGLILTE